MQNSKLITIEKGPDAEKTFRIRKMSALQLEKWCFRALIALFGSQADVPPGLAEAAQTSNAAAFVQIGLKGLTGLTWEKVESLYDELLRQVDKVPNPENPEAVVKLHNGNADAHVESAGTLFRLRAEVLALCLNFSLDGVSLESLPAMLFSRQDLSATPTSPTSSGA